MKLLPSYFNMLLVASLATACVSSAQVPAARGTQARRVCAGRTVASDAELGNFKGCSQVIGDMTVTGSVTTLAPLASVGSVWGTLAVASTERLQTLSGLGALRAASNLVVSGNARLDDLSALHGLQAVRNVTIASNPKLETLSGLEGLRSVEHLTIASNGLYTLHGLGNVYSVGELVLTDNHRLTCARGLAGVIEVHRVVVEHNPRLSGLVLPKLRNSPTFDSVAGNTLSPAEVSQLTAER